ncbi:hypothetical protein GCM10027285_03970 [Oleiagrimonas citrea]|jgi:hypothetical protein|uniref:Uncharacterized protein n=1 Tax=Oleiagrimonas citrea TaxID=1665687 RepID=A0A846ZN75_9GAMM|nr:hypothetical protein [Oleiagrimonas citrea]NKZ39436.1 hypothetical protein [Oleiagrimonas citrea]
MTNTIELLESIGQDASLRHASAQDLEQALESMHASDALRRTARTGDVRHVKMELGGKDGSVNHNPPPFNTQTPPPPPPPPHKNEQA